jgi:hypothetical protein
MFSSEIEVKTINHLGLIAGIIDDIGLEEIINEVLGVDDREIVTSGQVVKAVILNSLGFVAQPLYLFPKFFEDKATEHLLGKGVKANYLNDDKIGRVMDKLYEGGLSSIFFLIALAMVKKYQIKTEFSHLDSTSFSVQGEYEYDSLIPPLSSNGTILYAKPINFTQQEFWILNFVDLAPIFTLLNLRSVTFLAGQTQAKQTGIAPTY